LECCHNVEITLYYAFINTSHLSSSFLSRIYHYSGMLMARAPATRRLQNISEGPILLIRLVHLEYIIVCTDVDATNFLRINFDTLLLIPTSVLPHEVKPKHDD
jgi:hypothetical protein